jgi:putative membrane protein
MEKLWLAVFGSVLAWSGTAPRDYYTWVLEVAPAIVAFAALAFTRRCFPLTPLSYMLILIHSIILMVGGHYTYAEVPLGEWVRTAFDLGRNDYDKLGHFAQGFVPAIVVREILRRRRVIAGRGWLLFLTTCVGLAISAFYELIEWWVALASDQAAEAFLGTQGYIWDTQSDMAFALAGALLAQIVFMRLHDRQIAALAPRAEQG